MTDPSPAPPPLHAFSQGVGTVFQFVGVGLFLISMFVCCSSSLLSKDTATHSGLTTIGWHRASDSPDQPSYSAQWALTITLPVAICNGMALAALGLGLQSERRAAAGGAVVVSWLMTIFWGVQLVFFISIRWVVLSMICSLLVMLALVLLLLSVGAVRDMFGKKETQP
jgi:lipopolysaccharide export LptBFGC system permease protein LptF